MPVDVFAVTFASKEYSRPGDAQRIDGAFAGKRSSKRRVLRRAPKPRSLPIIWHKHGTTRLTTKLAPSDPGVASTHQAMLVWSALEDSPFRSMARFDRRGTEMRSDPEDEPGIYLFYAFVMFVAIIAAAVVAAGVMVHVSL